MRWVLLLVVLFALAVACRAAPRPTPAPALLFVEVRNFAFNPANTMAVRGTRVTWTNRDSVAHTVTSTSPGFDSGRLAPGQGFSFVFTQAGTFNYICSIHPYMTAVIVVR